MTAPTVAQLRAHEKRLTAMLADPECVGEVLLVGIGMARSLDLGDPPFPAGESMPVKVIADAIYGRHATLPPHLCYPRGVGGRGDSRPRRRILDVFHADRRRYRQEDVDRFHFIACSRPMIRRDGLCGRDASSTHTKALTDPLTGRKQWVGACSQTACQAWMRDLLARNAAELEAHPAPRPAANVGGVLERHLPEIDWWQVWRHVDPQWTPPPEGRPFERPHLTLLLGDARPTAPINDVTTTPAGRPALTVLEGGWR